MSEHEVFTRSLARMDEVVAVPHISDERWALREAAAVRWTFREPDELTTPTRVAQDAQLALLDDCRLVETPEGDTVWILSEDVRAEALRRLASTDRLRSVLAANEAEADAMQRLLAAIAAGAVALERLDFDDLTEVLKLSGWLGDTLPGVPRIAAVEQQLASRELVAPLKTLTDEGFYGRDDALKLLDAHVFGPRSIVEGKGVSALVASAREGVDQLWFTLRDRSRPPLLIHAPGGSGKSTLISRFILSRAPERFIFAHIDFDRPRFEPREPLTLLTEIVRQVSTQLPEIAEPLEHVASRAAEELHVSAAVRKTPGGGGPPAVAYAQRARHINDFGKIIRDHRGRSALLVLAIDTLEEVLYRGQDYVEELWYFLGQLQRAVPGLRIIAAGRTELPAVETVGLPLADLNESSARSFLAARLAGVVDSPNDAIIATILATFPRSPLTLKLAADVVRDAGEEGLRQIFGRRGRRNALDEEAIQGVLYRRIIDHLHDEDVKRLALPGLALRRLTPEVIDQVLAEPSGVSVEGPAAAADLFARLAREVALVDVARDGSLRYRTDVRRLALRLLANDDSVPLREVDQRAVEFYKGRDGEQDRAEEIYHRLRLKQDRDVIERRWLPGLDDRLGSALEDLEPAQQGYLAAQLGLTLSSEALREADQRDWERHVERRARYFCELRDYERARKLLDERSDRLKDSPLPLIEAEVLNALGKRRHAAKTLEAALKRAGEATDPALVLGMALASARIRHSLGEVKRPQRDIDRAAAVAHRLKDPVALLRVRLTATTLGLEPKEKLPPAAELIAAAPDGRLLEEPQLVLEVAARFGGEESGVLEYALDHVGLPGIRWLETATYASRLAEATGESSSEWNSALSKHRRDPMAVAALFQGRELTPELRKALAATYADLIVRVPMTDKKGHERREAGPVPRWANPRKRQS